MKYFDWNKEKSKILLNTRGVSFEMVQAEIEGKRVLVTMDHPNQARYPGQKIYVVRIMEYTYAVPFVEDDEKIFLKTIFPSRKFNQLYSQKYEKKDIS